MDDDDFGLPYPDQPTELDLVYEELARTQLALRQLVALVDVMGWGNQLGPILAPVLERAHDLAAMGPVEREEGREAPICHPTPKRSS